MNKSDIIDMITAIAVEYPRDIDLSKDNLMDAKVNLWLGGLKNYPRELVEMATQKALSENHFCPKLADIISAIKEIQATQEPSQEELWSEFSLAVQRASLKTSYFAFTLKDENGLTQGEKAKNDCENLYNSLPKILKEYCGNYNGFMAYAYLDNLDDKLQYEKGRFMKRLDEIKKRLEIQTDLSEEMKNAIGFNVKKLDDCALDYKNNKK